MPLGEGAEHVPVPAGSIESAEEATRKRLRTMYELGQVTFDSGGVHVHKVPVPGGGGGLRSDRVGVCSSSDVPLTPVNGRKKPRVHHFSPYPSSSSESVVPSPASVLAMGAMPGGGLVGAAYSPQSHRPRKTKGRVKTAEPSFLNCTWTRAKPCCQNRCEPTPSSSEYTVTDVLRVRSFWYGLSATDRRQFLASRIVADFAPNCRGAHAKPMKHYYLESVDVIREGKLRLGCSVNMRRVCRVFFEFATGTTGGGIYQRSVASRDFVVSSGNRQVRRRHKADGIEAWLGNFASFYQISPDSDYTYLPYANKEVVYGMYEEDMKRSGMPVAKKGYYNDVWRSSDELSHIRIRKWLRFATCDLCVDYRKRRDETNDDKLRVEIKAEEKTHHIFVSGERGSYYKRQTRAEVNPEKYISMIIDGSDNSQYWSPYFRERTSTSQSSWKVGLHVMGAVVHGRAAYAYTILDTCPLGANVTIDILHRVLEAELLEHGSLPRILYLQLDNTTRQCKNRYVLGWLAYLVQIGLFDEVYVSFLPKGHTHEDIDQMFSRIAKYLRGHDCLSPRAFTDIVQCAYKYNGKPAKTEHLTHVANISDWLDEHIVDLELITQWHQFWIRAQGSAQDRKIRLRVREWIATGDERSAWLGLKKFEHDSAVLKETPRTTSFLQAAPFSLGTPPPLPRKAKRQKTNIGDKDERDPVKRLHTDVEKLIEQRRIGAGDAASLRESVKTLNAVDADDPLAFDWDVSMYEEAFSNMFSVEEEEVKEAEDLELQVAGYGHVIGSVWLVRSNFSELRGWKNKNKKDLELFWLCRVSGVPYRKEGVILVPVRYYECDQKLYKRPGNKKHPPGKKYAIGESTAELGVDALQLNVKLNNTKKSKSDFINHHWVKKVAHVASRIWMLAKGKYRGGRGGGVEDVESDDDEG